MRILSLNAGSSSLKAAVFDAGGDGVVRVASESVSRCAAPATAVTGVIDALEARAGRPDAIGHRLVHGGVHHRGPARLDDALRRDLEALVPLAPLHLPSELAVIDAARRRVPEAPNVVCFDTAFHRGLPEVAERFPVRASIYDAGLRRFGFHGLSYEHVVEAVGKEALGRAVALHLGNGASLAAIVDGRSIDTSMGLTPTGGIVMGTRSGDLDPGLLVHLARREGFSPAALDDLVNRDAGLLGISGTTSDMRDLLAARATDPRARLAVAMFAYSAKKAVGAYAAALGGLDSLVFTGGIGEHAPEVRAAICEGLEHLGVRLDADANAKGEPLIDAQGARVRVRIVPADEERMIAIHVARTLGQPGG